MKKILWILCMITIRSEAQNPQILEFSRGGNEPSLAVNPDNNAQVVLAYNNFNVFKSSDTGKTFKRIKVTSKYGFYGDPVLYWGFGKNAYLAHLAKNKYYDWPLSFDRIVFQKIKFRKNKVKKSTGVGFNPINLMVFTTIKPDIPDHKMQDKPWFTINRNLTDPHYGRIHMAWTEFDNYGSKKPGDSSRIRYAWSDNKGKTFSKPLTISQRCGDAKDGDSTLEGATICVDKTGNTYSLWSGLDMLWFTQSKDGGMTWEKPYSIGAHENGWHLEMGGMMRANGMPFMISLDKHLLAVWAAKQGGKSRVFYRYYNIESKTWGEIRKVIIPETENTFMPQVCARGNKAYIAFYSSTETAKENTFELKIYTAMLDEHNANVNVTGNLLNGSTFISEGKPFLGDYIAICPLNQSGTDEVFLAHTTLVGNKDTYIVLSRIKF